MAIFIGTEGADAIIECVGIEATITQVIIHARKGSHIIVVGVFAKDIPINIGFIQDRELKIIGSAMYQTGDYVQALELAALNKINFDALISKTFRFSDYEATYKLINEAGDSVMKVMKDMKDMKDMEG